jgi:hypothetical protein
VNKHDAEEYTQSLGQIVSGSWRQVALAQRLGVPQALGLSVEDWVQQRLGGYIRMSIPERREAVKELISSNDGEKRLTNQEIGEILGVSEPTVRRDSSYDEAPETSDEPQVIKPAPYRNAWMSWTSAVEHLTSIPYCGLGELASRTPEENKQLIEQAQIAIANLNNWIKELRSA